MENRAEHFADNNGIKIHFLELNRQVGGIPLILIPGATNSAEQIEEDLKGQLASYHIIVSLRGRGQSDSPDTGYQLDDHASDVHAVARHLGLDKYYLFGYSVGSTVGIRVAVQAPEKALGLIMGDFPPYFPSFDKSWADRVARDRDCKVSRKALTGLAHEGKYVEAGQDLQGLTCRLLLIKGGKQGTAFNSKHLPIFGKIAPTCQVLIFEDSGHDIFRPQLTSLIRAINEFMGYGVAQMT